MAKDPAFLFYHHDFLVGTEFMTAEEVGLYIRILCHLADKGILSEMHMQSICRGYAFSDVIKEKLSVDKDGCYYQQRLRNEVEKRRLYSESRRNNAKAYAKHMENRNVNRDKDINTKEKEIIREKDFNIVWERYPNKDGRKDALRHFKASVNTEQDLKDINTALGNYLKSEKVLKGFIKNGSTWFNNWRDWVLVEKPKINQQPPIKFEKPDPVEQAKVAKLIHETKDKIGK